MKVAILAPITWRTPPRNYGPWEQVVSVLTEALVQKGVDVTLFATGDAVTKAQLQYTCERPIGEYPADFKVQECLHIANLMQQARRFDIIHNHFDFLPLTYSPLVRTPFLTTIHGFSSEQIVPVFKKFNASTHYVSISNSNRHPQLHYLDTVYNGIDPGHFSMGAGEAGYLLFFGRIHAEKGAHEAIQIARAANKNLLLCGLIQDQGYFNEKILPYINDTTVQYLGNVGPEVRNLLLGNASALLHPISFEEPFGLSVAEAMMCGTPVIAFQRGSMQELIVHRKTGFLVQNCAEAVLAIGYLNTIDRAVCRQHAIEHFSAGAMADGYIRCYKEILTPSQ